MLRVNKKQLDQLNAIYGKLETKPTRHGVYIIAREPELESYRRFLQGSISKKQKSALYWYNKKTSLYGAESPTREN